jgi:stearoyl-CoA desaturase (delta-9 desaturase)
VAGIAAKVTVMHITFCVNSVAHYVGDFTFSDQPTPPDSFFTSFLTFGEDYHNFHHEFAYGLLLFL